VRGLVGILSLILSVSKVRGFFNFCRSQSTWFVAGPGGAEIQFLHRLLQTRRDRDDGDLLETLDGVTAKAFVFLHEILSLAVSNWRGPVRGSGSVRLSVSRYATIACRSASSSATWAWRYRH